jgi:serine/threonine-protein kinase
MQLVTPPPRPSERQADVAPAVEAVILKAIRKRPENRYPSMDAFIEDLERLAGDRPGRLAALSPLAAPDDVYVPRGAFAKNATAYFYKKLGKVAPRFDE